MDRNRFTQTSLVKVGGRSHVKPAKHANSAKTKMACTQCRVRKIRCDGQSPQCGHCRRLEKVCKYEPVSEQENNAARERKRLSRLKRTQEPARVELSDESTARPVYTVQKPSSLVKDPGSMSSVSPGSPLECSMRPNDSNTIDCSIINPTAHLHRPIDSSDLSRSPRKGKLTAFEERQQANQTDSLQHRNPIREPLLHAAKVPPAKSHDLTLDPHVITLDPATSFNANDIDLVPRNCCPKSRKEATEADFNMVTSSIGWRF